MGDIFTLGLATAGFLFVLSFWFRARRALTKRWPGLTKDPDGVWRTRLEGGLGLEVMREEDEETRLRVTVPGLEAELGLSSELKGVRALQPWRELRGGLVGTGSRELLLSYLDDDLLDLLLEAREHGIQVTLFEGAVAYSSKTKLFSSKLVMASEVMVAIARHLERLAGQTQEQRLLALARDERDPGRAREAMEVLLSADAPPTAERQRLCEQALTSADPWLQWHVVAWAHAPVSAVGVLLQRLGDGAIPPALRASYADLAGNVLSRDDVTFDQVDEGADALLDIASSRNGSPVPAALRSLHHLGRAPAEVWIIQRLDAVNAVARAGMLPLLTGDNAVAEWVRRLIDSKQEVAVRAAELLGEHAGLEVVMALNEARGGIMRGDLRRAAGEAVAKIQARHGNRDRGGLSVAGDAVVGGQLNLTESVPEGALETVE